MLTKDPNITQIISGQRVRKDSPVIEFMGAMDELSSMLGVCVSFLENEPKNDFSPEIDVLLEIQKDLAKVKLIAAGGQAKFDSMREVLNIKETINDYVKLVSNHGGEIIPGGSVCASHLYLARSLARKVERRFVSLNSQSLETFVPYLNSLSNLLFVMAEYVNKKLGYKQERINC